MADNYLITGYWGEPHVTAENDRGINAAMFGTGRFVLPVGEQFKADYIGNNTIRMYDGKLMDNGAAAGIPVGEYVDLLIANAGQGKKRNDLIVFQYKQDASTLIESGIFTVIQGAESSGTASDPALTQEDLLSGEAAFDQMALWRVPVSGTTISAPVKLFSVYRNNVSHAADKNNPHGVTPEQIGAASAGLADYTPYNGRKNFCINLLDVNMDDPDAYQNKASVVATEDASTLANSPITSDAFYAYREVLFINSPTGGRPKCIVKLTQSYPMDHCIWLNVHDPNIGDWSGWKSLADRQYVDNVMNALLGV